MGAELDGIDSLNQTLDDIAERWGKTRKVVYIVGTNEKHGPYIEFGTDPHPIEGDPLVFTVDGETVFAQSVDHPGTDPQPFMRPAAEAVERQLQGLADDADSVEEFVGEAAFLLEREAKDRVAVDDGDLKASIETRREQ